MIETELREQSHTPRGVSPAIAVILMATVAIILAAVIGAFVLGIGGSTSESAPAVSFSVDQQGERLLITHNSGDTIATSNLKLTGIKGWGPSEQDLATGDTISTTPEPGAERVDIVWEATDSASVLRTLDVSNIEVSSLVVNDGFERGTGDEASGWTEDGTAGSISRTDEQSLSGQYSMKLADITTGYGGRTIVSDPVEVTGGQEYEFGGSYYLSDPDSGANPGDYRRAVRVRWFDSGGTEVAETSRFADLSTFDQWTEVRETKEAPSDAVTARIVFEVKYDTKTTDVYWDETFIEPVE